MKKIKRLKKGQWYIGITENFAIVVNAKNDLPSLVVCDNVYRLSKKLTKYFKTMIKVLNVEKEKLYCGSIQKHNLIGESFTFDFD